MSQGSSQSPLRRRGTQDSQNSLSISTPVSIQSSEPAQDEDYDWRDEAACRGRSAEFFPKTDSYKSLEHISVARKICNTCPVLEECREWTITSLPATDCVGIFAGLSPRQIASEQARLGITQPKYLTIAAVWASFEAQARRMGKDLYERHDDALFEEIEEYPDDDEDFLQLDIDTE